MVPELPVMYTNIDGLATIDFNNGVILMDHSMKKVPDIVWDFVYHHERYHLLYNTPPSGRSLQTEIQCDFGAIDELLREGAKVPQILWAMEHSISDPTERQIRIAAATSYLKKNNIIK